MIRLDPESLPLLTLLDQERFQSLLQRIRRDHSEAQLENEFIVPFLQALGYQEGEWRRQAIIGKARVDFLVCSSGSAHAFPPYLIIETKAPKQDIGKGVWQIHHYMRNTGAIVGLLTNGYHFKLLYNYNGKIYPISEFDQDTLISQIDTVVKILSKTTCVEVVSRFSLAHHEVHTVLVDQITQVLNKTGSDIPEFHLANPFIPKPRGKSMIITVFNNKGGVGKTTTTINLAGALNKLGYRILLIDIDAQANLTMGLGIDPLNDIEEQNKKDITHLLTEPRTTLESVIYKKRWGDVQLDIVPSHIRLSEMEPTLLQTLDIDNVLVKKLKKYKENYDFIFIDPPPSFSKVNSISLMASDAILIPTELSSYPIRALEYTIGRSLIVQENKGTPLPILGIIISMYNVSATKLAKDMTEKIIDLLMKKPERSHIKLFPDHTWIPKLTIVSTTPDKGYPLCCAEYDHELSSQDKERALQASASYTNLAKYLVSITENLKTSNLQKE